MFRALLCPSSGARQTAVAASGFRINVKVEVFVLNRGRFASVETVCVLTLPHTVSTLANTPTSTFIRKPEAATAV